MNYTEYKKMIINFNIHSTQCRFNIILHNHNHKCSLHTELHIHSFIHNYNNLKSINLNIFSKPIHINLYVYNFWVKNKFKHVIRYHLHYCQGFWVHSIQNCEQGWKKTLGYNCYILAGSQKKWFSYKLKLRICIYR